MCRGDLVHWIHRYPVPLLSFCAVLLLPAGATFQALQRLVKCCGQQKLLFAKCYGWDLGTTMNGRVREDEPVNNSSRDLFMLSF